MTEYMVNVFINQKFQLGESPFYDSRTGIISWVDIVAGKFYRKFENGAVSEFDFHQEIGAAVPMRNQGEYVIAGTDGLYKLSDNCSTIIRDLSSEYESFQRSNDAKADPAGRLWFGSSVIADHAPCGNLYSYDGETLLCKQPETGIANGMAWNMDKTKFYFSDSKEKAVFVYDYDVESGIISNRKVLFTIDQGVPDGMTIDSEDNLWVAVWGGERIEKRSSKDGSLLGIVKVPATNVTSCCFMGDNLDNLLITTSGMNLTGKYDGFLFICQTDTKGVPTHTCSL